MQDLHTFQIRAACKVLCLNYGDVPYDQNVSFRRSGTFLTTSGSALLEGMPILEKLLATQPDVAIVSSLIWVRTRSDRIANSKLSPTLPQTVIGAPFPRWAMCRTECFRNAKACRNSLFSTNGLNRLTDPAIQGAVKVMPERL